MCSLPQHVSVAFSRATKSNWEAGSREWLKLKERKKEGRKEGRKENKEKMRQRSPLEKPWQNNVYNDAAAL